MRVRVYKAPEGGCPGEVRAPRVVYTSTPLRITPTRNISPGVVLEITLGFFVPHHWTDPSEVMVSVLTARYPLQLCLCLAMTQSKEDILCPHEVHMSSLLCDND